MPHSIERAKRLLRELPRNPEEVLERPKKYADEVFLKLFYSHLNQLTYAKPGTAVRWARIGPHLASMAPQRGGPGRRQVHRDNLARAWAISGSALLAVGRHKSSHQAFTNALDLTAMIDSRVSGDVLRRMSYLRACQSRNEEALELALRSTEVARKAGDNRATSLALLCSGYAQFEVGRFTESLLDIGEALLTLGKPQQRSAADMRLHTGICLNLAQALIAIPERDLSIVFQFFRQGKQLVKGGCRFLPRYRMLWVEGLAWNRLGMHARAEKALEVAIEGFQTLRLPHEIALTALDLGEIYQSHGEWGKLELLAKETFRCYRVLAANTQTIQAVSRWCDAVKARHLTEEVTSNARLCVLKNIGPGGWRDSKKRVT